MELLLDQGLPRSSISHLKELSISATHVGHVGLADATDAQILDFARRSCFCLAFRSCFSLLIFFCHPD
jgi:predicted nuclease of predicted toxin-antitoxin system